MNRKAIKIVAIVIVISMIVAPITSFIVAVL